MSDTQTETFQELIHRAKNGEQDAFGLLYEEHLTPVFRYAFARLGNREEADDIAQETFLRAYKAIDRFEVTTENFLPYLFTIARNLLINKSKKKTPVSMTGEEMERQSGELHADASALEREQKEVIQRALAHLTESEREIIELRFFAERSYAEIAILTEKREDAIRQQVARALRKMRQQLNPQHA